MNRMMAWKIVAFTAILLLLTVYGTWWKQMIATPELRTATDFMAFYAGGRVADKYGFPATYTIELQQDVQEEVLGFELAERVVLLYNHLPYIVPILSTLVDENYAGSFTRWVVLLLLIYLVATIFFVNQLSLDEEWRARFLTIGGMITFFPLFISLWQGQDTAFVYLGVAVWGVGLLKKQDTFMAIGLALTTVRPHIAIALGLPILFRHRKAVWQAGALGGFILLFCLWLFKLEGLLGFLQLIRISAEGTWFGMKPEAMFNLLGLIIRTVPTFDPSTANLLSWLIYGIGLILVATLWLKWNGSTQQLIGLTVLIAILFAPHLHLHDLTLLVFPILFVIMKETTRYPRAIFLLGASLVLLVSFLAPALYHLLPYLLCLLLAWRLLQQRQPQKT